MEHALNRRQFTSLLLAAFASRDWWSVSPKSPAYAELLRQIDAAEDNWELIVTLEARGTPTLWMQVVEGMVNFHCPFSEEPKLHLANHGIDISEMDIVDWLPGKCLTLAHNRSRTAINHLPDLLERYSSEILCLELSPEEWEISTILQNG